MSSYFALWFLYRLIALLAYASALAADGVSLHAQTRRFLTRRTHQHHVRDMNGRFLLNAAALGVLLAAPDVLVYVIYAFDHDLALACQNLEHLARLAGISEAADGNKVPIKSESIKRKPYQQKLLMEK